VLVHAHRQAKMSDGKASKNILWHAKYFRKILISNFMKIRRVETELFHADGQTGMIELTVASANFARAPE
jgi:hypothetical protein